MTNQRPALSRREAAAATLARALAAALEAERPARVLAALEDARDAGVQIAQLARALEGERDRRFVERL